MTQTPLGFWNTLGRAIHIWKDVILVLVLLYIAIDVTVFYAATALPAYAGLIHSIGMICEFFLATLVYPLAIAIQRNQSWSWIDAVASAGCRIFRLIGLWILITLWATGAAMLACFGGALIAIALMGVYMGLTGMLQSHSFFEALRLSIDSTPNAHYVFGVIGIVSLCAFILACLTFLFASPILFDENKSIKTCMQDSRVLIQGAYWSTFFKTFLGSLLLQALCAATLFVIQFSALSLFFRFIFDPSQTIWQTTLFQYLTLYLSAPTFLLLKLSMIGWLSILTTIVYFDLKARRLS